MYLRGEGVAQSDALALAWFEKAAAQGNTSARIKLGYLYASGREARRDAEAAYAWILSAVLAGDNRGQEYLVPLEKQLSTEQLVRAKERARALQAAEARAIPELAFLR
jgi:TPR repeat protein